MFTEINNSYETDKEASFLRNLKNANKSLRFNEKGREKQKSKFELPVIPTAA